MSEIIDYPFGELNPALISEVSDRYPSDTGIKGTTLMRSVFEDHFKRDVLKSVGRIKAVVLRVENSNKEPGEWLSQILSLEGREDGFVRVKARIPELHPLPLPNDSKDHKIINLYPTFKAKEKNLVSPSPGDLIWVEFGNREQQTDPIYLGPITSGKTTVGGFGKKKTSKFFSSKKDAKLNAKPPTGDQRPQKKTVKFKQSLKENGPRPEYSRNLDDLDFNLVPSELLKKWSPDINRNRWRSAAANASTRRKGAPFPLKFPPEANDNNNNQKWSIIVVGCAEVIEQYWRQEIPDAKLIITSHFRNLTTKNHNGGAIDYKIVSGNKTLTALQIWSGTKKLELAGKIPAGSNGLYLNVSDSGIKGLKPDEAGEGASAFSAPPGGSSAPHYDFRNHYGYNLGRKGGTWLSLDLTGEGNDDIPGAYSYRERIKVRDYLKGKTVTILGDNSKLAKNITTSLKGKKVSSKIDLNFLLDFYQNSWNNYEFSPGVDDSVPSLLSVLGQELNNNVSKIDESQNPGKKDDNENQKPSKSS